MGSNPAARGNRGEAMKTVLVTGSSGLLGSACVRHFHALGHKVYGIDCNARKEFFGKGGDTEPTGRALFDECPRFEEHFIDIRNRNELLMFFVAYPPEIILHCAAQPSHDYATHHAFEDFEVNAVGTLNLLEACRRYASDAVFCFASTNKVYGDAPNQFHAVEETTRYDWRWFSREFMDQHGDSYDVEDCGATSERGVNEQMRIDQSRHSLFGVSKAAADLMVQEYARTFGMKTGCFRFGCLTGTAHAGVELHGFLAYLAKCCREGIPYKVYGYKGKQVRDQLHAADAAAAFAAFAANPRPGEVYNLGGGRENSVSVLEAIDLMERATGRKLQWEYVEQARGGDHIVYYSDTSKFRRDYPEWRITRPLASIIEELAGNLPLQLQPSTV